MRLESYLEEHTSSLGQSPRVSEVPTVTDPAAYLMEQARGRPLRPGGVSGASRE